MAVRNCPSDETELLISKHFFLAAHAMQQHTKLWLLILN